VEWRSGFAALQCGKAPPFRRILLLILIEAAPRNAGEAQPRRLIQGDEAAGQAKPDRTGERHSR